MHVHEGEGGAVRAVRGAEEPYPPRFDVGLRSKSSVVDELSDGGGIYIYNLSYIYILFIVNVRISVCYSYMYQ